MHYQVLFTFRFCMEENVNIFLNLGGKKKQCHVFFSGFKEKKNPFFNIFPYFESSKFLSRN